MNKIQLQEWLIRRIATLLAIHEETVDIHASFVSYGMSSIDAVTMSGELERLLGRQLPPGIAYDYPSINKLAEFLAEGSVDSNSGSQDNSNEPSGNRDIAVIGMACRFPGAGDISAFWDLLKDGVDAISEVPADRWEKETYFNPDASVPGKSVSYWGGFLNNIDQFDPFFFGISPVEAEQIDPQQRLLLELSYEALEDAGKVMKEIAGSDTGVFVGISLNEYGIRQFQDTLTINSHSGTGSALSIAANRLSYFYDFKGPSMAIDTACSSSLTAIHMACKSLKYGECGMALAGGVNLIHSPAHSIAFTKAGVLSADGKCKPFDSRANGYVRGEGSGLLVLKPLDIALRDQDRVYAVIKGSAIRQDGRSNGIMAPNRDSQEKLLSAAIRDSGIEPGEIQYIEAHGTGTLLGDEIEARAIGAVIGKEKHDGQCIIGSVKSNIGHLEAAAGIAGIIKVILSMKNGWIPANVHYESPNPHVDFGRLNLKVSNELIPWPNAESKIAGVSSFGFGGTNVHVVLSSPVHEGETPRKILHAGVAHQVLTLSAHTSKALDDVCRQFMALLGPGNQNNLSEICYNASVRKNHLNYRVAFVTDSKEAMETSVRSFLEREPDTNVVLPGNTLTRPKIAFVFSGQGGQWTGMGRKLYGSYVVFKSYLDKCDEIIRDRFGWSLLGQIFEDKGTKAIDDISFVQPMLFSLQVSLSRLLESFGVRADALIGHSMGEVAAAYLSGALCLEDSLEVICVRSSLIRQSTGKGIMLVTDLPEKDLVDWANDFKVDIAAYNSPHLTVFTGDPESINALQARLEQHNFYAQLVQVDVASHSPQMDKYRDELTKLLNRIQPRSVAIPIYSTVSGQREDNLVLNADYWVDNLRQPVLFLNSVQEMINDGYEVFIEIGPHPILLGAIQQTLNFGNKDGILLPTMNRNDENGATFLQTVSKLFVQGYEVSWSGNYLIPYRPISLPAYPWQRQRFWLDLPSQNQSPSYQSKGVNKAHTLLGGRVPIASEPNRLIWTVNLDLRELHYLQDHQVGQEIILPASAYIEIGLQAAEEAGILGSHDLCDMDFRQMMVLSTTHPSTIQTEIRLETERILISIHGKSYHTDEWSPLFSGVFKAREKDNPGSEVFHNLKGLSYSFDAELFYRRMKERGIQYGMSFRAVQDAAVSPQEVTGRIELPGHLEMGSGEFHIHPVRLDAAFQLISLIDDGESYDLFLPRACEKITYYPARGAATWCRIKRNKNRASPEVAAVDLEMLNEDGQLTLDIQGFQLQKVQLETGSPSLENSLWLYQTVWERSPHKYLPNDSGTLGNWLIISDDGDAAPLLADKILATGGTPHLVNWPESIRQLDEINDLFLIQLFRDILSGLPDKIDGVVHLSSLSISVGDNLDSVYELGSYSVLYLIKGLLERYSLLPRLWIVTKGVHAVHDTEEPDYMQSTLWGLAKSISFEQPELRCVRIDLDPAEELREAMESLHTLLSGKIPEDQIAIRQGVPYVHRIVLYSPYSIHSRNRVEFNPNSSYVIAGGLGGLGFTVASWMIGKGVKNMVLIGRSQPTEQQRAQLNRWMSEGINVRILAADVTKSDEMDSAFGLIFDEMPPVKGVIHAAGSIDDAALVNLDQERLRSVMATKLEGTVNLHNATKNSSLDFFVLFSSLVSVLGSPGQGNYAAACSFQDAFAQYRLRSGLPALSINWGPWAEVGLAAEVAARLKSENNTSQQLVKVIEIEQGLEVLELLLNKRTAQVAVVPFDLANLIELYPPASEMPFFQRVLTTRSNYSKYYTRPNLKQDYLAPGNELEKKLAELWQQTLRIDKVGIHDSFFELGGDSVLAAQIITSVQKSYGIRIELKDAFKAFTVESLAKMTETELLRKLESMSEQDAQNQVKNG